MRKGSFCFVVTENVELILKSRSGGEGLDNDQPDYDSVASDEDTDQEPPLGKDRTKVTDVMALHANQVKDFKYRTVCSTENEHLQSGFSIADFFLYRVWTRTCQTGLSQCRSSWR